MNLWEKAVGEQMEKCRAEPNRPYNVHFYEVWLGGRLRIFDLLRHPDPRGTVVVSIGESLVGQMRPLRMPAYPPMVSPIYTHVNYGGAPSQSPDEVLREFAANYDLSNIIKLKEIQRLDEMMPEMDKVLSRLYSHYGVAS